MYFEADDGTGTSEMAPAKVDGKLQKLNANSLPGVRLDYRVGNEYARSVLFHGAIYDKARTDANPWGLKAKLDDDVPVADLAKFQLPLKKHAPAGWTGKVHISFFLQDTGPGTGAKFTLRPGK